MENTWSNIYFTGNDEVSYNFSTREEAQSKAEEDDFLVSGVYVQRGEQE